MNKYSLSHLSDGVLLRDLKTLVSQDRVTTATLLAHLAEVNARRLYVPAAQPSMYWYCVRVLGFSEDVAYKRTRAARAARRFPLIFQAIADGRLHVSGVVKLAPHLTSANANELLTAAERKCNRELDQLLAERFPQEDAPERLEPISRAGAGTPASDASCEERSEVTGESPRLSTPSGVSPATDSASTPGSPRDVTELAPGPIPTHAHDMQVDQSSPAASVPGGSAPSATSCATAPRARLAPLAPERYVLQVTIDQETFELLERAKALLGHAVPTGEIAAVLKRALQVLVGQLEKRKCGATDKPRPARRRSGGLTRHVPAPVRRTVWARDGGRCTFVSDDGERCPERGTLEYDHIPSVGLLENAPGHQPNARPCAVTASEVRLRCRSHNQYAAEQVFGVEFMRHKRESARESRNRRRAATAPPAVAGITAVPPSGCLSTDASPAPSPQP